MIMPANIQRIWRVLGILDTIPPRRDPALKAARNVEMSHAQTKIEVPKCGAKMRDARSCRPIPNAPRKNKMRRSPNLGYLGACVPGMSEKDTGRGGVEFTTLS
jgi:hypothetical protein